MTSLRVLAGLTLAATGPLAAQPALSPRDSAIHAVSRLAYGPTPGLVDRVVREGVLRWVDRQLAVDQIEDPSLAETLAAYELLRTPSAVMLRSYLQVQQQRRADRRDQATDSMMSPAERQRRASPEARELRELGSQLMSLVLVRATRSERQLGEVLADFWTNHFNVFVGKALDRVYLPAYIEEVIRPGALGSFEELLIATASSPAMMIYLDNAQSIAPGAEPPGLRRQAQRRFVRGLVGMDSARQLAAQRRPTGLNENYARELLELHTLGVDGGYTQKDVTEVARILTGWSVAPPPRGGGFLFNEWAHDRGAKNVLGVAFPAGQGREEGLRLLRTLAGHAATMHFVSGKLCARFVNDVPPDGCIDDAVRAWKRNGGKLREVVRAILHSRDFWAAANVGSKVKTPLEFVVSAVRAVGGIPDTTPRLAQAVARLGQPLYQHVAPNGYGERQEDWVNSGALLNRMNIAVALAANRLPGVSVDLDAVLPPTADRHELVTQVDRLILGGKMSPQTRKVILEQIADLQPLQARALAVGLAVGGPEFQRQ